MPRFATFTVQRTISSRWDVKQLTSQPQRESSETSNTHSASFLSLRLRTLRVRRVVGYIA